MIFLPAHIEHNLFLDSSHHVTVMGPRLKSEQQRTYFMLLCNFIFGRKAALWTQRPFLFIDFYFYSYFFWFLFNVFSSVQLCSWKKNLQIQKYCHHLLQLIILTPLPPPHPAPTNMKICHYLWNETALTEGGSRRGWGSQTGSGWVGERVAGPLHFCSCSKLRHAASLGSFRSSCHFSPSTVLSNQSAVRPSADAPPPRAGMKPFFSISNTLPVLWA